MGGGHVQVERGSPSQPADRLCATLVCPTRVPLAQAAEAWTLAVRSGAAGSAVRLTSRADLPSAGVTQPALATRMRAGEAKPMTMVMAWAPAVSVY
jgi:hypothetical protein